MKALKWKKNDSSSTRVEELSSADTGELFPVKQPFKSNCQIWKEGRGGGGGMEICSPFILNRQCRK